MEEMKKMIKRNYFSNNKKKYGNICQLKHLTDYYIEPELDQIKP